MAKIDLNRIDDSMVEVIDTYLSSLDQGERYSEYSDYSEMPKQTKLEFLEANWEMLKYFY